MDIVALPLLTEATAVNLAVAVLKQCQRTGIVVDVGGHGPFKLFHAGEILAARATHLGRIADLSGGDVIELVSGQDAKSHRLDLVQPMATQSQYEAYFRGIVPDFAVVGAGNGIALLVTRSEQFAEILQGPGGYQCTGNPQHYFPLPRVTLGQRCPSGGHQPGGGVAVIVPAP